MRVITLSIASLMSRRKRGSSRIEPDELLLAQIPPAMMQYLVRQGWLLEFVFLLFPAVAVFAVEYVVGSLWPEYGLQDAGTYVVVVLVMLLTRLFNWRSVGRGAVQAELRYHHQHGKWRWEH